MRELTGRHRALPLVALGLVCAFPTGMARAAAPKATDLIRKLRWAKPDVGRAVVAQLLKNGEPAVRELAALIHPPGKGDDADARFALQGLVLYVMRSGSEADRLTVSRGLIEALAAEPDPAVAAFLIRRLQLVGRAEAVEPLARYLGDDRLCEPATQALIEIDDDAARAALRNALRQAVGKRRVTLVRALGRLRDRRAATQVLPLVDHADRELRIAAWYALANSGEIAVAPVLEKASRSDNPYERSVAVRDCLLLARRLGQAGRRDAAVTICRKLLRTPVTAATRQIVCGALAQLAELLGKDALPDLVTAIQGKDWQVRAAALRLAQGLPGAEVTAKFAELARNLPDPAARAAVIDMLGERGDPSALPAIEQGLVDRDENVRKSAAGALELCGGDRAVAPLLAMIRTGEKTDVEIARRALARVRTPGLAAAAAASLAKATPTGKVALLELLATRNARSQTDAILAVLDDPDRTVRLSALKSLETLAGPGQAARIKAFLLATRSSSERKAAGKVLGAVCRRDAATARSMVQTFLKASPDQRAALGQILAGIGGKAALEAVTADLATPDPVRKTAAVRTLAAWRDAAAAPALLGVLQKPGSEVQRVLALRGYLEMVSALPAEQAAVALEKAWNAVKTVADRKLVLSRLGNVRSDRGLGICLSALDDPALRQEAAAAIVQAVCPHGRNDRGLTTALAFKALTRVAATSKNKALVARAKARLAAFPLSANLSNLALGKPVKTSVPQQGDKAPERAVDGKLGKLDAWFGARWPCWYQVDLGTPTRIDTIRVIFYWDGRRYYTYTVDVSKDGKTWTKVVDNSKNKTPSTARGTIHRFKPVEARYVRLNVLRNSVNEAVHVVEFEVYGAGKAPHAFTSAEPSRPKLLPLPPPDKAGFISLFNGKDLTGWMGSVNGYGVENGVMFCKSKGGGKLLTTHQFGDFIFQFDFKMPPGANNGVAVRAPADGNPAYAGMEIQIIDNKSYEAVHHYKLKPWQVHGSIYGVVPAKTGALKPAGEWNHEEIRALGRRITVIVNGKTIVDADLSKLTDTADGKGLAHHPGLFRDKGHIGWLGHGARVEFRNIRIKPFPPYTVGPQNVPPPGFKPLFNGKDLTGWKGLVKNPEARARMSPEALAAAQKKADENMREHWRVKDGALVFDGKGKALCTAKDYADFEMYVDWKIEPHGDSGIYLRGSPQVQIWDFHQHPEGSGGLYNNRKHPNKPLLCADNPIGQWNRFRIKMIGERVTVWLNGELVVNNVVMENYWDRNKPIYPTGQIELQNHGSTLWFKNIYIREIPRSPAPPKKKAPR
ncbi:MAG: DUF1080 domain-containing protein [Kiritimatiellaeota bacterium]|nr:DUF1080 domain-containing protein [Kiritimatiellota bacterium]